jgi:enamine deaminase RidA (YjgF/YER057c/UK114 family)
VARLERSNPDGVAPPAANGYAHAVRVPLGDATLLVVSGQLPIDADGELVGAGDLRAQTRQVFENLRITFADVAKIGTYVTDLSDLEAVREVRRAYLQPEPPASTLVQVVALVLPDAMIEVDLEAVIG